MSSQSINQNKLNAQPVVFIFMCHCNQHVHVLVPRPRSVSLWHDLTRFCWACRKWALTLGGSNSTSSWMPFFFMVWCDHIARFPMGSNAKPSDLIAPDHEKERHLFHYNLLQTLCSAVQINISVPSTCATIILCYEFDQGGDVWLKSLPVLSLNRGASEAGRSGSPPAEKHSQVWADHLYFHNHVHWTWFSTVDCFLTNKTSRPPSNAGEKTSRIRRKIWSLAFSFWWRCCCEGPGWFVEKRTRQLSDTLWLSQPISAWRVWKHFNDLTLLHALIARTSDPSGSSNRQSLSAGPFSSEMNTIGSNTISWSTVRRDGACESLRGFQACSPVLKHTSKHWRCQTWLFTNQIKMTNCTFLIAMRIMHSWQTCARFNISCK